MARSSEPGSGQEFECSLRSLPESPTVSQWLNNVTSAQCVLDALPPDHTADLQRAAATLFLAHLRHRAPVAAVWQQLHSPDWEEAVRTIEQFAPPVRWALSAAAGAWFARHGNEAGFETAIRILKSFRYPATSREEVAHGALLVCIEHQPALLGELMRSGALKWPTPLVYLARTRPAAVVREGFRALEEACCECSMHTSFCQERSECKDTQGSDEVLC